jgi:dGTPase
VETRKRAIKYQANFMSSNQHLEATDLRDWTGLHTTDDRERLLLARYAMHSADTRGRKHEQMEHAYRAPYQRDRDRILHCSAFRRLSGKTQVFTGNLGDYHRTRLTHTVEVSSIARTIGRALGLNEDLIEALALLHDIGHPPFGHAGEDALAECLAGEGGFSHNRHGLRIVEELEQRYPRFPGLNLTLEVLESQASRIDKQTPAAIQPLMEAQVVEASDSMTYDSHDVDDAIKLGLITLDELLETTLVRQAHQRVKNRHAGLSGSTLRKAMVHELVDWQVTDVLLRCGTRLEELQPQSASQARTCGLTIGPSKELAELKAELEAFLYQRVYRHESLIAVRATGQQQIQAIFAAYLSKPDLMPPKYRQRVETFGAERTAADYIAGMTDRYCVQQFEALE